MAHVTLTTDGGSTSSQASSEPTSLAEISRPIDDAEASTAAPRYYCAECMTALADDLGACSGCHAISPTGAWPSLSQCDDRWLGRWVGDRYRLEQRIGTGSAGVIYRATSTGLGRSFALKIVALDDRDISDGTRAHIIGNLHREIEVQSQFKNPHMVHLFDVLEMTGDCIGILMDLVEGVTLQQLVESNGPLSIERACTILRQAAIGMHEAHEAGMVHRDLKPHNLMVETLPSGEDFVRVLDFGIMCLQDAVDSTRSFAGTPAYASPEQAACERLDRRSDIYSMGVVFFFMLTATTPFRGHSTPEVLTAHISTQPPKLSDACPQRWFPEEIEQLVARLMSKQLAARPRTLAQLISEIDGLLGDDNVLAASHTGARRADSLSARSEADTVEVEVEPEPSEDSRVSVDWPVGLHLEVPEAVIRFPWTVTPDGRLIYLHEDGELKLVDSALDTEWALDLKLDDRASAFCLAEHCCYVGTDDGEVHEFSRSFDHRRRISTLPDASPVRDLACDYAGQWLTVVCERGDVFTRRVDSENQWHRLVLREPAHSASVSAMGSRLAVMTAGANVNVFRLEQPRELVCRVSVPAGITAIALDNDASRLACLTSSRDLAVLGLPEGKWQQVISGQHVTSEFDRLAGVDVGPDDTLILVGISS
jgi:serine/threonine protein kinase